MVKFSKKTSAHLILFLFAQNTWTKYEKDAIKTIIHKMLHSQQASFLIGTTDRKNENCVICSQIFVLFTKIQGKNDGRLFISHNILDTFYIWDPDHRDEVLEFTNQILQSNFIKKFYILQVDSFKASLTQTTDFKLSSYLKRKKHPQREFVKILQENSFESNVIYEIVKDSYS